MLSKFGRSRWNDVKPVQPEHILGGMASEQDARFDVIGNVTNLRRKRGAVLLGMSDDESCLTLLNSLACDQPPRSFELHRTLSALEPKPETVQTKSSACEVMRNLKATRETLSDTVQSLRHTVSYCVILCH